MATKLSKLVAKAREGIDRDKEYALDEAAALVIAEGAFAGCEVEPRRWHAWHPPIQRVLAQLHAAGSLTA